MKIKAIICSPLPSGYFWVFQMKKSEIVSNVKKTKMLLDSDFCNELGLNLYFYHNNQIVFVLCYQPFKHRSESVNFLLVRSNISQVGHVIILTAFCSA